LPEKCFPSTEHTDGPRASLTSLHCCRRAGRCILTCSGE
jgi:hypothetical protein